MKCANCDNEAVYSTNSTAYAQVNYCSKDLPPQLVDAALRGELPLNDVTAKTSKKKSVEPEVAPEVEAPVVVENADI